MEAIKNALDFSDFPRIDLIAAALVLIFMLAFPVFHFSSFAMATMIQFLMFGLFVALTSSLRVQRRMRKLPPVANIVVNLVFIAISFKIGRFLWRALESSIWPW